MRDGDPFEDDIRALLRDAHREEPAAPPFGRMWQRAHVARSAVPRRRILVPVLASALAVALTLAWIRGSRGTRPHSDVAALLASVRAVEATPLDFLLATPGADFVAGTPRFGDVPPPIDLSSLQISED